MGLSKIEWCHFTFNPWIGCTKVAEGCKHCYAETFVKRTGKGRWGPRGTRAKTSDANWRLPIKWNEWAAENETRFMVFCASLADVFEDWRGPINNHKNEPLHRCHNCGQIIVAGVGCQHCPSFASSSGIGIADLRRELFTLIDATPNLDWLLLTKRPENISGMTPEKPCTACKGTKRRTAGIYEMECDTCYGKPQPAFRQNVWLGCSVATQSDADQNIPALLKCRHLSPVLFVSAEPLIEETNLYRFVYSNRDRAAMDNQFFEPLPDTPAAAAFNSKIDWVIVGGESGPHARPFNVDWARDIVECCNAAGVAVFVKQLGRRPFSLEQGERLNAGKFPNDKTLKSMAVSLDSEIRLRDPKGGNPSEWPKALRVREFPQAIEANK